MQAIRVNEIIKGQTLLIKNSELKKFEDMKVEVIIIPFDEENKTDKKITFKTYKSGGAINKFDREDIYSGRNLKNY